MVIDDRADHSLRVPRPDLSLELGTPNACSDCHDDKPVQWSQDAIVEWYGAERLQGPHYAVALHAGRTGAPKALARLRFLAGAEDQPEIARATALSLIPRYAAASEVPEVVSALGHADPLIRGAAVRALASSPPDRQLALRYSQLTQFRRVLPMVLLPLTLQIVDGHQQVGHRDVVVFGGLGKSAAGAVDEEHLAPHLGAVHGDQTLRRPHPIVFGQGLAGVRVENLFVLAGHDMGAPLHP